MMKGLRLFLPAMAVMAVLIGAQSGWAQGCVVARLAMPVVGPSAGVTQALPDDESWFSCHRWEASASYRYFHSFRHFIGTTEQVQREIAHTQVNNVVNVFDYSGTFTVNRQMSLFVDVPMLISRRFSEQNSSNPTHGRGIGDVSFGAQMWLFAAPEGRHNIQLGIGAKIPTGNPGVTDVSKSSNGTVKTVVVDQSIQPGDGGYGFSLSTQAYQGVGFLTLYGSGLYLFNPRDTNGVQTGRSQPAEQVMSVPDQYQFRAGATTSTPGFRRSAMSFGIRWEGVPVRDAFGKSDGFRRPGYTLSVDPGFMVGRGKDMFSVNTPIAVRRNRARSVPDIVDNTWGDAAFADYQVVASFSHHF
jgi:hypothetical protein